MAGYSGYSKSNNAVCAEENGVYPATKLAKILGVRAGAIKALMTPSEWHHTSMHYKKTDYYSQEEATEMIDALKVWRPEKKDEAVLENCDVSWVEWSGTRNYPQRIEHKISNVTVTRRGEWYLFDYKVTEKLVQKMRKNGGTRDFEVRLNGQIINTSLGA